MGILAGILGEPVEAASVPGGYYTRAVAQTAADAGVRVLFNSEPTIRVSRVGGCLVLGRYAVLGSTPANRVAALAQGRLLPRMTQALLWNGKKVVKAAGGEHWLRARQWLLSRR